MKRIIPLLLSCLLLCACSPLPSAQPPVAFLVVYNDHLEEVPDGGIGEADAEYIYIFIEE